jgi:cystathionine gamma-lyase
MLGRPVTPQPILASAYPLSTDVMADLDAYARSSNPTWRHLESALAQLEGAAAAVAFNSGMAAISAALRALAKPGRRWWCRPTATIRSAATLSRLFECVVRRYTR